MLKPTTEQLFNKRAGSFKTSKTTSESIEKAMSLRIRLCGYWRKGPISCGRRAMSPNDAMTTTRTLHDREPGPAQTTVVITWRWYALIKRNSAHIMHSGASDSESSFFIKKNPWKRLSIFVLISFQVSWVWIWCRWWGNQLSWMWRVLIIAWLPGLPKFADFC